MKTLLILGGTGEAVELAERCARSVDLRIITALAGRTRDPVVAPGELYRGGFGGCQGLAAYLRRERVDIVIDASHPFAGRISAHAASVCAALALPLLHLVRPPWMAEPHDRWYPVADAPAAAALLPRLGQRVFYAAGHKDIAYFGDLRGLHFVVRLIEAPERPLRLVNHELILARGPFRVDDELDLLSRYRIDTIVCKNSGGVGGYGKLAAARGLGIPVVMIERPALAFSPSVATVTDALDWLQTTCFI